MEQEKIDRKRSNKLARAISKIGLSWATYAGIVDIREEISGIKIDTAAWYYEPKTGKERIAINPSMIDKYTAEQIGLVVKHELLHKAMYRNIEAKDRQLINFALDCCINKILTISQPRNMFNFCKEFYTSDRTGVSCVGNCSLSEDERDMLAKNLREIWNSLYAYQSYRNDETCFDEFIKNNCHNQEVPDPLTIYNKLLLSTNKQQKSQIKKQYSYMEGKEDSDTDKNSSSTQKKEDKNEDKDPDEDNEREEGGDNLEPEEKDEGEESSESGSPEGEEETTEDDNGEGEEDNGNEKVDDEDGEDEEKTDELESEEGPEDEGEQEPQIRGGPDGKRTKNKQDVKEEVDAVNKTIMQGGYCAKGVRELLHKTVFKPQEQDTKDLKDFIGTWQTMRQVEGIEATIYSEIASHIKFDPYPDNLSRTGLEYVALGVSGPDELPFYLNNSDKRDAKKKVCCYFDTSPSMTAALPAMVHIAKFFDALEETQLAGGESQGKYVFSGSVEGLTHSEWVGMCNGELKVGYSTSFDQVIEHSLTLINEEDVDIIVILTDGESSVSEKHIEEFNHTTKRCYRIYFDFGYNGYGIKRNSEGGVVSSLDQLNGSSFSVKVNNGTN